MVVCAAGPRAPPDFYASADAVLIRTIMGDDLRATLSDSQRLEWIGYLTAWQNPADGSFPTFTHHSKLHANGTAIGALGPLGGRMDYPVELYRPLAMPESVGKWLETIDWSAQWTASHL